jgi:hypothetical protein
MFVSETPDMDKDYKRSPSLDSLEPEFHHFQSLSLSPDRQISPPIPSTSKQVNSPAPEENQIEPTVTFEGDDLANEESVRRQQEVASRLGLLGHQQKGQKSDSKGGRLSYPEESAANGSYSVSNRRLSNRKSRRESKLTRHMWEGSGSLMIQHYSTMLQHSVLEQPKGKQLLNKLVSTSPSFSYSSLVADSSSSAIPSSWTWIPSIIGAGIG